MKKSLLLIVAIFLTNGFANGPLKEIPKPPLSFSVPLLQTIRDEAIIFGTGPTSVHVFVDPMCPRSQEFVTLIAENDKMKELYTYYFYFFELKRFNSKKLIETIYEAKDIKKTMIGYMKDKVVIKQHSGSDKTRKKIRKIAEIAEKIGVYKRPYLILIKKGKN